MTMKHKKFKIEKINLNLILVAFLIIILFSFQGLAGCGRWVVRENTDYLADPIFESYFKDTEETNSQNLKVFTNSNDSNVDSAVPTQEILNDIPVISGKWQIDLDKDLQYFKVFLIQSGERFQGYGTLVENETEMPATAIGNISGDSISLDANIVVDGTSSSIKKKYRFNLFSKNETLTGGYEYFEDDMLMQRGNATAIMI
jgi:hypothetical protein